MTSPLAQYKEYLRAMLEDDTERARQVLLDMGDGPWEGTGRLNLAVFKLAVEKRFKAGQSHTAIKAFVAETHEGLASADSRPNPLHTELLIRSALGETALFDEVPDTPGTRSCRLLRT
jgi:hypothetical protein